MTHYDLAVADQQAKRFGVPSPIHPDDFLFVHHVDVNRNPTEAGRLADTTGYYFTDGDRSARRLDGLVRRLHPELGQRRLSLLEFASGYGCVSRHLDRMRDRYGLSSCDIHPQAVSFLRDDLGIEAIQSVSRPEAFRIDARFDVVFALSFFSHMPPASFADWLRALFDTVAENGILLFTTHGRIGHANVQRPALHVDGYWFAPLSEQKDLPADEYGCMISTPHFVLHQLLALEDAELVLFEEASWWDTQDIYAVRRRTGGFRPPARAEPELQPAADTGATATPQPGACPDGPLPAPFLAGRVLRRLRRAVR